MNIKPFGEKAYNFIHMPVEEDRFFTLLEGSIRSSKTWAMMVKLLALCKYEVEGQRVITGRSKSAIKRNVLSDLFNLVGRNNYRYNAQSGELYLYGVLWWVIGAADEGSESMIRGMTIGICYSDETALMPESFFDQLMARMSPEGARFYGTTNPDTPFHYLMEKVINNREWQGYQDEETGEIHPCRITILHFSLDDNPNLSRKSRARYESMYTGVFYQRFILGLWVVAEGAIFRDSLGPQCEFDEMPLGLKNAYAARYIPVDYGTGNPTVFLDVYDDGRTMWQEREYYWDSKKELKQKTDEEYADDFDQFVGPNKRGVIAIVDPSAASFKLVLQKRGYNVRNAKNDVMPGIRRTGSALKMGLYRIRKEGNKRTWLEMSAYAWDPKKLKRGEEEGPIKQNDHAVDPVRYCIHTALPDWRLAA